ncbi:aspartate aminotransferase family protein [Salinibacterium xinjiangense]|uniref:Taurine---2-oxoglutarate transaminase n=1 Tax=Salinibacterium xinjiangense TaxID=386302 RepID=A0A2C8ZYC0_9MICO|nr:aspartate aminotransferase family protein [Salinibacterium xinjiangense]GGL00471.1 aspartate aminotransferase family protein [Salinibacterium xinjiangense]SOE71011.1 taurine---2-oxoglutarate transaminase [Salinibacterium xinjiangense]
MTTTVDTDKTPASVPTAPTPSPEGTRAYDLDRAHVFHSWSAQGALNPMVIAGGRGSEVWDFDGNTYLDFSSQLVNTNMGHQHPAIIDAIKAQADILATVAPAAANLARGEAAQRIVAKADAHFGKVFFTNGGADAIENAIRMARITTGRDKILSTYRSYHGNTGAAIVATGDWRRMPNEFARGHAHFFGPFEYRSEFWSTSQEQECERALQHLERVIVSEGASTIAAILLETVPGTAGVLVPPPGYLPGVRALCDRYGILLILDEVMCGFGRTGQWFAWQGFDVVPDLVAFAKGVNSGYVPAGGVLISESIANEFETQVFPGGLTYSGHPLAMASIVGSIDAMDAEGVVENARTIGTDHLGPGLAELAEKHEMIGNVRGLGVFWALDLVDDRESRQAVSGGVILQLKKAMLARGLLPFSADNRIHVVPPCIVTPDQVAQALSIYDEAFTEVEANL